VCQFLRLERYFVIVTILVELRICITGIVTNPRLVVSHAPMMASNDAFRPMNALSEGALFRREAWGRAGSGGFAPAPPGFSALVPLPMRALCRQTDERGCRSIPPESVEATESALGLLPSIALSTAAGKEAHLCGGF
jgi:hypothetical protein